MGKRVAILGGGMAALTTAWQITKDPDWRKRFDTVDIYQMGWRLGGKCASGRGPMRRIEEHGIHLFGGGYYNTLPMMREVYRALHGGVAAGDAAFKSAFEKQFSSVRVRSDGVKLLLRFPENRTDQAAAADFAKPGQLHRWLAAAVQGMRTYLVDADDSLSGPQAALMFRPTLLQALVQALDRAPPAVAPAAALAAVDQLVGALQAGQLAQARQLADQLRDAGQGLWPAAHADSLEFVRDKLDKVFEADRGMWGLSLVMLAWSLALDFIAAVVLAWLGVIESTKTLETLDGDEYHVVLTQHGARPATLESDLVMAPLRILYQFRDGDSTQASLGAGCFLHWLLRSFAYAEAPFWFFAEGTGETVIRPLYLALRQRGVNFHFFHQVESIQPAADGRSIAGVTFRVQAETLDGRPYEPLDGGCWPDRPLVHQLKNGDELVALPPDTLESYWSGYRRSETYTLALTPGDDAVVLAIPPAALPAIAPALLAQAESWRNMVASVASVETQSLQLWLDEDSHTLGVNQRVSQPIQPDDTFLGAGFVDGFHTFADFSPLIRHEGWPVHNRPRSVWYFSDVVPTAPGTPDFADPHYPLRRQALAIGRARAFAAGQFGHMLPGSPPGKPTDPPRFDLAHLVVPDPSRASLPTQRIDQQHIRANCQPSERYVQALANTTMARLPAGKSATYNNLYLAGDWTHNGLNVGCVEATVMSGKLAGNALLQLLDPAVDVAGYFPR